MAEEQDAFLVGKFPEGFKFGLATSAYQVEGAWNLDGKSESTWDVFCHDKDKTKNVMDGSNGDVACDSYHKYKEDVQLLKDMGAKVYRFSVAWTRILPDGTTSKINQLGIDYYNRLIGELIAIGIEPMITLFHWDTPATCKGDWVDEAIIHHFGNFARVCFAAFGDRVKNWITINEPYIFTMMSYDVGVFPPANNSQPEVLTYQVGQNLLKAHATAYHIYQEEFKELQKGRIGISLDSRWFVPADPNSESDVSAADRAMQFRLGWFAHPIFKGDYPPVMRKKLDAKSKTEGRLNSRLPKLGEDWISKIKGSCDFLGLNHYTTNLATYSENKGPTKPGLDADRNCQLSFDPTWPTSGVVWLRSVPWGLRKLLKWIKDEYNNPEVIITENGVGTPDGRLDDTYRVEFFKSYINEVLKAIVLDGCNVTGYIAWSLLDCFEWNSGYTVTFGVHAVDLTTEGGSSRTARDSAKLLTEIFKNHGFLKSNID